MTDVRLTATNPEDSSVVPVACNEKGELKLEEPIEFDGNLDGNMLTTGSITAAGSIKSTNGTGTAFLGATSGTGLALNNILNETVVEINYDGSITAAGTSLVGGDPGSEQNGVKMHPNGYIACCGGHGSGFVFAGSPSDTSTSTSLIFADGSAIFDADVIVGSRSKIWKLVEQGGLCHMVEETRALTADVDDMVEETRALTADVDDYPKLRDVFQELNLIEQVLQEVMEKLRLSPPAGWPVWDGSDETP